MQPLPAKAHEAWQSTGFLPVLYLFFCSLGPSSPAESAMAESGGAPVAAWNLPPSAVVNPRTSWGKIRQRPAYIYEYLFCTQSHVLPLHWNKPSSLTLVTPRSWRPCSLYGAPLRQFLYGAPLRQFPYGAPLRQFLYGALLRRLLYDSSSTAASLQWPLASDL
jgi:hypothetical protein